MKRKKLLAARVAMICITILIIASVILIFAASHSRRLNFSADYHFVYYRIQDDAVSASSVSSTVQSYGGAGYVIQSDNKYYITVACYYSRDDAVAICDNLKKQGLSCEVLSVRTEDFVLQGREAENDAVKFEGNLNTLDSLARLCYETANAIDKGECDQQKAKGVLTDIGSGLSGLLRINPANCFTQELSYLITRCADVSSDYIYSKDARALQIAIVDCILNVKLV